MQYPKYCDERQHCNPDKTQNIVSFIFKTVPKCHVKNQKNYREYKFYTVI